jgi:putative flippase GtrA
MLTAPQKSLSVRQFAQFALIGAGGTSIHFLTLTLLISSFDTPALSATILGSLLGAFFNFVLNHRLTFCSKQPYSQTAPRFLLLAFASIALNAIIYDCLATRLHIHFLLTQCLTTGLILVGNYCANALWTFQHAEKPS